MVKWMKMTLMVSCFLPLSVSTTNRKSVFMSMVSNQSHSMWAMAQWALVGLTLRQGCILSPFHNLQEFNLDKCSQTNEGITIENCKIHYLLFADDLV